VSEDSKQVLIAGAGPTGMMAAIELSRFNIGTRAEAAERSRVEARQRLAEHQAATGHR
jgi:2-polyprenyl-6-methoxyphenol hydroxylase-like FAD-dependent oxidoreductase